MIRIHRKPAPYFSIWRWTWLKTDKGWRRS